MRAHLERKILAPSQLGRWAQDQRAAGKTIATINGCFDLLHPGHLYILFEGSRQADILLVALNVDRIISLGKGPNRPINNLNDRLHLMAASEFVDFATHFEEATPLEFLEKVRPDVHINGAEYGPDCVEAPVLKKFGGRLHLVESFGGYSTSAQLRRSH